MYAMVTYCDLTEGYLGRSVVVIARLELGCAAFRSIIPQICYDE